MSLHRKCFSDEEMIKKRPISWKIPTNPDCYSNNIWKDSSENRSLCILCMTFCWYHTTKAKGAFGKNNIVHRLCLVRLHWCMKSFIFPDLDFITLQYKFEFDQNWTSTWRTYFRISQVQWNHDASHQNLKCRDRSK